MGNEMLGNQYFMARDYRAAEIELAPCLEKNPDSKPIRRKLIICYTQNGDVQKALTIFSGLIQDDIEFVISADKILDDCPCPELLDKDANPEIEDIEENYLALGILWLYCDVDISLNYFRKALFVDSKNDLLKSVLERIEDYHKSRTVKK